MRTRKRTQEELALLRRTLATRISTEQPPLHEAARWVREALGLSQEAFGKLVGLSKPQVSKLEKGEGNPTLKTLQAIGRPFKLQLGFIPPAAAILHNQLPAAAPTTTRTPRQHVPVFKLDEP
jgi:transcriptional regulator with XRE-family HTH domain